MSEESALCNIKNCESPSCVGHPHVKKNIYIECDEIEDWLPTLVEKYLTVNNITASRLSKSNIEHLYKIPKPIQRFVHIYNEHMLQKLFKLGYNDPTAIQKQALPIMLSGENVIGISPTRSGKTLCYVIGSILHFQSQKTRTWNRAGPRLLVLSSKEKRVLKITEVYKKFNSCNNSSILGDYEICSTFHRTHPDCIISTPPHFYDVIVDKRIDISFFSYIILDSADDMWCAGFEKYILFILNQLPPVRQIVMMSVTFPSYLQTFAEQHMCEPIIVENAPPVIDPALSPSIKQHFKYARTDKDKYQMLLNFAKGLKPREAVLVYCLNKARAIDVASTLATKNLTTQCVESLITENDWSSTEKYIQDDALQIITDYEYSGKNFPFSPFKFMFHFDLPTDISIYKERVNRAMRKRQDFIFITFISPSDKFIIQGLHKYLTDNKQIIPGFIEDMFLQTKETQKKKKT
ncbi:probable ATP-dependent RNA helicase DDX53, partial [Teleopsis dalmanni]